MDAKAHRHHAEQLRLAGKFEQAEDHDRQATDLESPPQEKTPPGVAIKKAKVDGANG